MPVLTLCGAWCRRVTEFNYQAPCSSSGRSPNVSQTLQARPRTEDVQEKQVTVCCITAFGKVTVAARTLCTGRVLRASCGLQGVRMVFYDSDANLLLLELPSIPPSYRPYYLGNPPRCMAPRACLH